MMAIIIRVKRPLRARCEVRHMKVSKTQVDDNRRAILEAAGRLFRQRGFDAVSVAEVMAAAGLTHGAFYGYFRSKDELVAAALADLLDRAAPDRQMGAERCALSRARPSRRLRRRLPGRGAGGRCRRASRRRRARRWRRGSNA